MSEEHKALTPDPPYPPGTPVPPNLDVDLEPYLGERKVQPDDDVNPEAGAVEPPE